MSNDPKAKILVQKISNEIGIRYEKSGHGPPLLLLHTIRTQLEYFRDLAPILAKAYTVYAIDLPGHGHSPIEANALFDEPYLRQGVIGFIEAANLNDLTVVGESIGGTLALTVAATIPQRIRRVFAVNPYDYETRFGDGIRRGNLLSNIIIGGVQIPLVGPIMAALENRIVLGGIMSGGFHDPRKLPSDLLDEYVRVSHRRGYRRAARKVLKGWRSWAKARADYTGITAPVTLVYGDTDWSRPEERERTLASIPNARRYTLKETGHFSAVENPAGLAHILLEG